MTREADSNPGQSLKGRIGQPDRPVSPDDMTQACAEACTPGPLVQLRGTVLRYDSPTDPVWPLSDPSSTTQQAGIPARRFGALAGRITIAPDFDAPLDLTDDKDAG